MSCNKNSNAPKIGRKVDNIREWVTSKRWRFFSSTTPIRGRHINFGGQCLWRTKKHWKWFWNSRPLLLRKIANFVLNCVSTALQKSLKIEMTLFVGGEKDPGKKSMVINKGYEPPFPRWGSSWMVPRDHSEQEWKGGLVCMVVKEKEPNIIQPECVHHKLS